VGVENPPPNINKLEIPTTTEELGAGLESTCASVYQVNLIQGDPNCVEDEKCKGLPTVDHLAENSEDDKR
jgi:hypothetical protein